MIWDAVKGARNAAAETVRFVRRGCEYRVTYECAKNIYLPKFESGKSNQYQHHGDDPETHHYLRFFPAFLFIVMV